MAKNRRASSKRAKAEEQNAVLDYIIAYGWAILALVIIAGLMWYFGVFGS